MHMLFVNFFANKITLHTSAACESDKWALMQKAGHLNLVAGRITIQTAAGCQQNPIATSLFELPCTLWSSGMFVVWCGVCSGDVNRHKFEHMRTNGQRRSAG